MRSLIICFVILLAGCNQGTNTTTQVMIVGDSISIGYTGMVQDELAGKYDVFHAEGGPKYDVDRTSTYFLAHIDKFMKDAGPVDIIHANWGLWDAVHSTNTSVDALAGGCNLKLPVRTSLDEYRDNLEKISAIFEKTGARIIFATTTPVQANNRCILPEDIVNLNRIIVEVAKEHGFQVDNLYSLMLPYQNLHEHGAHYSKEGYQLMSYQVDSYIEN